MYFFMILKKLLYFARHNGLFGAILFHFTMNSRIREGRKMTTNVAKTLGRHGFLYFLLLAWNMNFRDFERSKGTNLGPKTVSKASKIAMEKRGS